MLKENENKDTQGDFPTPKGGGRANSRASDEPLKEIAQNADNPKK